MVNDSGGKGHRKRDPAIMAAWIAGVLGVVGIVVGVLLTHVLGGSPQSGQSTTAVSSPPVVASTNLTPTSSPAATPTTAQSKVILQDNFCSKVNSWNNAEYSRCTLLIRTKPNQPSGDIESSEPKGSSLYPQAPSSVVIEVTARMITDSTQGDLQFGMSCRANVDPNGYGYAFIVGQNLVKVIKYSNVTGQVGPPLA